jgi:GDP-L-fucose synthase
MNRDAPVFVAGHRGLAGSALVRALRKAGYSRLLVRDRRELDLRHAESVAEFFRKERPAYVFLAAAKVGGIHANKTYPADFITDNLSIQSNVIQSAYLSGAEKLLFLGSACIYPKMAPQPMPESSLLTGPLEPANEAYAIAKIAGLKMCQAYRRQHGFNAITVVPANLYGPGDNFSLENSHVLPALMRKFHDAKEAGASEVEVWGTGRARREFLHADDLADACLFLMREYTDEQPINVGWGRDVTIAELAALVARTVGFTGELRFDASRPEGTARMLVDPSHVRELGWAPQISLDTGLVRTYAWYLDNMDRLRK